MPQADSRNVAAIGFSYGGAAALLMGMRNSAVRAVVGYDASFISQNYGKFLLAAPEFSVDRARFPMLEFHAATADASPFIVDRLRYAERWSVAVKDADHIDFTSAPLTSFRLVGDRHLQGRTLAERAASFVGMARTTRLFLDHVLKGAPMLGESVREQPAWGREHVSHQAAITAPLSEAQLMGLVTARGAAPAIAQLDQLLKTDPKAAVLSATSVNRMGYALLSQGNAKAAVDLFLWNVRRHPLEASWFDSLADGYAALGNPACTAAAYRRVLEALPRDPLDEKEKVALHRTANAYLNKAPAGAPYAGCDALHAAAAGSHTTPAGHRQQ